MKTDTYKPLPAGTTTVAGVILAAGCGRRMGTAAGRPKQLLPFRGAPLLSHVMASARASRLAPLCLVLGHRAAEIEAQVELGGMAVVVNTDYGAGQAGSLVTGLARVRGRCSAAMFLLGDQPLVTADLIDTLIDAHEKKGAPVTVPTFEGRRGNPVILADSLFPEVMRLTGDTGARALFEAHWEEIQRVSVDDPAVLMDVDDPADYERLLTYEP